MFKVKQLLFSDDSTTCTQCPTYASEIRLKVVSSESFPIIPEDNPDRLYFTATIIRQNDGRKEDVKVTATKGNEWRIERAQGSGQAPMDICEGSTVTMLDNAYFYRKLAEELCKCSPVYDEETEILTLRPLDAPIVDINLHKKEYLDYKGDEIPDLAVLPDVISPPLAHIGL